VTFVITKTNKDDVFASFSVGVLWTMATDDDGENGDGVTDDDVNEDGDGDGLTDDNGNWAMDDDDDDDDDGNNSNSAATDGEDVDDDNDDVNDFNEATCRRVGKRNDGCDETKTEEEETVADSVVIHTTIKQITGRGGGTWR